jgi:hypothetical protein
MEVAQPVAGLRFTCGRMVRHEQTNYINQLENYFLSEEVTRSFVCYNESQMEFDKSIGFNQVEWFGSVILALSK